MTITSKPSAREIRAALYPELTSGIRMDNALGQSSATLWQTVAEQYIKTTEKVLVPLTRLTTYWFPALQPASNLVPLTRLTTDLRRDALSVENPAVRPTVNVEVVTSAGDALVNPTDWEQTDLANNYVEVKLDRISRPFALSSYDLANGERIETKLGAAIDAVAQTVFSRFVSLLNDSADNLQTIKGGITPEFVASTVSCAFGDAGPVDQLILTPTAYASLIPHDAYGLPIIDGVSHIDMSALINTLDTTWTGLAFRRQGAVMAAAAPDIEPFSSRGDITVRTLGDVASVPLVLKAWAVPGRELIYNSVETLCGFAIADPASIAIVLSC